MTREEFIENVEGCLDPLRRFLLVLCGGDKAEADDIAQEAVMKAWARRSMFGGRAKFSTWLFRIACNAWKDSRKAPHANRRTGIEAASALPARETGDQAFRNEGLRHAMEGLSAAERACVELHYIEGYSLREIETITGITYMTVASHLLRARKKLKKTLEVYG